MQARGVGLVLVAQGEMETTGTSSESPGPFLEDTSIHQVWGFSTSTHNTRRSDGRQRSIRGFQGLVPVYLLSSHGETDLQKRISFGFHVVLKVFGVATLGEMRAARLAAGSRPPQTPHSPKTQLKAASLVLKEDQGSSSVGSGRLMQLHLRDITFCHALKNTTLLLSS